jgi:predicted nucleic acid-binding protein
LADTSAWVWTRAVGGVLRAEFGEAVVEGQIATCAMVRMELLYSSRNQREFRDLRTDLEALPDVPVAERAWDRAIHVYEQLARHGGMHHRAVKHPDLMIAAAAEAAGLTIVHYDEEYDRIAAITGQKTRWLAPRGTLA